MRQLLIAGLPSRCAIAHADIDAVDGDDFFVVIFSGCLVR